MAPALTPPQAALVRLSAAVAAGTAADVATAASDALAAGTEATAIYEILLQSYLFLGFPRAIEAFFAAGPVLAPAGSPPAASADLGRWQRDGESLCRTVYGKNYEKLMATMRGLSPDLASWMILEGYGKTLSRPALGAVEREYAVVAILTATRMWRQLRSHAIGAVNVGGTRAGVREAILLAEPWSGAAVVQEALAMSGLA